MTDPITKTEANDLPPAPLPVQDETLSRWGDDGGTVPLPEHAGKVAMPDAGPDTGSDALDAGDADLAALDGRVLALEHLLVALLAGAGDGEVARVQAMAAQIAPRTGPGDAPATDQRASDTAAHLQALLDRAARWDGGAPVQAG